MELGKNNRRRNYTIVTLRDHPTEPNRTERSTIIIVSAKGQPQTRRVWNINSNNGIIKIENHRRRRRRGRLGLLQW